MAVRYHSHEPDGRRIPNVRRAVLPDLDGVSAFVGTQTSGIIYLMIEPVDGLLDGWRKACRDGK